MSTTAIMDILNLESGAKSRCQEDTLRLSNHLRDIDSGWLPPFVALCAALRLFARPSAYDNTITIGNDLDPVLESTIKNETSQEEEMEDALIAFLENALDDVDFMEQKLERLSGYLAAFGFELATDPHDEEVAVFLQFEPPAHATPEGFARYVRGLADRGELAPLPFSTAETELRYFVQEEFLPAIRHEELEEDIEDGIADANAQAPDWVSVARAPAPFLEKQNPGRSIVPSNG